MENQKDHENKEDNNPQVPVQEENLSSKERKCKNLAKENDDLGESGDQKVKFRGYY